ncbi:PAP2 superfamily-domain-containing protein [Aspergillus bertholletiae]|uniref:PAP2 superfamily-domain-containing protein n=1 Tax=Aspergillus bertholletiae TaxID=1226010 RepID=A0A5N7AZN1_9EURO|nr:PAP2 superfamily-domain-containing protein [Aspergillus bertholletiae]
MASTGEDNRGFNILSGQPKRTSKRLVLSYVLDWGCIFLLAAAGAILYSIAGSNHVFSLDDPSLSYPLKSDTVSIVIVGIVCCAGPAILIVVTCLLLPLPWRLRLWELHAGWLGLGLSLAGAFFVTSGMKDVVGKPRPDLIARCQPDLANIATYAVGGLGLHREAAPVMVTSGICQNPDAKVVRDGFAAFPSGHSSFSWAGLLYLSLWLGAKFAISVPVRSVAVVSGVVRKTSYERSAATGAPPLYLLLVVAIPTGGALYICASRYNDYMHAGWDIMGGSLIGIVFAILGFLWYHAPAGQGYGGWAWGARSPSDAFGAGFASDGFGEGREQRGSRHDYEDIELTAMDGSPTGLRVSHQ